MTIASSMMAMSCLVDPVGAAVANQSNSGLQHFHTRGIHRPYVGPAEALGVKFRLASRALFLSLRHRVCFCCSCSGMNHTAPQGSILGTDFRPVGDINVEPCEGLLRGILEAFLLPTKAGERHQELTI